MSDNNSNEKYSNLKTRTNFCPGFVRLNAVNDKNRAHIANQQSLYANYTLKGRQFIVRDETPGYQRLFYVMNYIRAQKI